MTNNVGVTPEPGDRATPTSVSILDFEPAYSIARRAMTGGSRPASTQLPSAAASGRPARISTRSSTGTPLSRWLIWVWKSAMATRYPADMPQTAPTSPRPPAVAAETRRRTQDDAPVAASVRRSRAASLRIMWNDEKSTLGRSMRSTFDAINGFGAAQAAADNSGDYPGTSVARGLATVTAAPAALIGLNERGRIAPGLRADLLRVRLVDGFPAVIGIWAGGRRIL